ncbi:MAG: restriction endonuclease subunit S, partial [Bryobacteraceae bacterium]
MDRPWIDAGLKWAWFRERDGKTLLVQRVARMRGINGLHTDYLRYLIGSPAFTNHVLSIITGVNVPHISARDIRAFKFDLPPSEIQICVVRLLSAYDDLIEVNTRRIAILEEMARRLFDEWFINCRGPGNDRKKLAQTIPGNWRVVS